MKLLVSVTTVVSKKGKKHQFSLVATAKRREVWLLVASVALLSGGDLVDILELLNVLG